MVGSCSVAGLLPEPLIVVIRRTTIGVGLPLLPEGTTSLFSGCTGTGTGIGSGAASNVNAIVVLSSAACAASLPSPRLFESRPPAVDWTVSQEKLNGSSFESFEAQERKLPVSDFTLTVCWPAAVTVRPEILIFITPTCLTAAASRSNVLMDSSASPK